MPCATRNKTSSARPALAAQAAEDTVKMAMADRKTGRAPHRFASQPLSGISTARVTR
jgi:hypothetical protein